MFTCWCQSRPPGSLTLVSAYDKTYITPMGMQHISVQCYRQTGKTAPGDLLHFPARRSYFSLPPYSLFSSHSRSFFSIYFLSPPTFLLRFSSPPPLLSLKVFAQVARPNVAAPFVAITQSGCLPPCRTPLGWCCL